MTERIIGDSWYAEALGIDSLTAVASRRGWRWLLRGAVGRGVMLWLAGRRHDVVVTTLAGTPLRVVLCLDRLLGRRRGRYLVLLEFIPVVGTTARRRWGATSRMRTWGARVFWTLIGAPALRRHLLSAQTLTRWEIERNATHFGLEPGRLTFVPFFTATDDPLPPPQSGRGVLASGRAACDWETIFAAAADQDWPLTVVCGADDLARVTALNHDARATVLSEIEASEHARLVREAAVYLLALEEAEVSSGHVRVLDTTVAGTAVVASAVKGLVDYLVADETCLIFTPGDALSARAAVNRLLAQPELREEIVAGARRAGERWRQSDYLRAIRRLVDDAATRATGT